jgi:hypothetical protein
MCFTKTLNFNKTLKHYVLVLNVVCVLVEQDTQFLEV